MGDGIQEMLGQLREMRSQMERAKEALRNKTVDVTSGPVRLTVNGHQEVISVRLAPGFEADPARLEQALKTAFNDAAARSREMVAGEMSKMFGPGFQFGFDSIFR